MFTEDFLAEGIVDSAAWQDLDNNSLAAVRTRIRAIFDAVPNPAMLNEAQTQHRIIEPVLRELGWTDAFDVQTNLDGRGRANVPDYSFFATAEAFAASQATHGYDVRVRHAVAVGDAKQWSIGLDQSGGGAGLGETPASQLIRYLIRAEVVHHFNHRAASIVTNDQNIHNAAFSNATALADLINPDFAPTPQYWVLVDAAPMLDHWTFAFRDIARSTDERTAIGALVSSRAAGNTLPLIDGLGGQQACLFAAQFSSFALDYIARQKSQSTHLNWYIVEQLPVMPPEAYGRQFGSATAETLVNDHVLRLTYTAHDMAPFARDMGYEGPPFAWDEDERRHLRARLDALYFHLYSVTDEADIRYVLSTFPIVERKDRDAWGGVYLTAELIVWYFRALAAGDTETVAPVVTLLRQAERAA